MTDEEINGYIAANEPTLVDKDEADRWERRVWQLEDGSHIVESYQYVHPVNSNDRQLFKVKNVTLEHVQLDSNYQTIQL